MHNTKLKRWQTRTQPKNKIKKIITREWTLISISQMTINYFSIFRRVYYFRYHRQYFVYGLFVWLWVTRCVSYTNRNCVHFADTWVHSLFSSFCVSSCALSSKSLYWAQVLNNVRVVKCKLRTLMLLEYCYWWKGSWLLEKWNHVLFFSFMVNVKATQNQIININRTISFRY
jgi:hypothetical protein